VRRAGDCGTLKQLVATAVDAQARRPRPNAAVVSVHSGGGGPGTPGRGGAVAGMSSEDPVPGVQHTQRFSRA
jgi:hypothetical protein